MVTSLAWPATAAPTAMMAGLSLAAWAYGMGTARLYTGAVVVLYAAAHGVGWTVWPRPEASLGITVSFTVVLVLLTYWKKLATGAVAILLLWIPFSGFLVPESRLELGVLLLASGFMVLVLAVSYNWARRKAFGKGSEEWG